MRHTAAEKAELIRLVEGSELSGRQTVRELRLNRSTFYAWYRRYTQRGLAGLTPTPVAARRHWNRIRPRMRQQVVEAALADPERSPRELAWRFTDREGHFLSESSVYRILKAADLIASPAAPALLWVRIDSRLPERAAARADSAPAAPVRHRCRVGALAVSSPSHPHERPHLHGFLFQNRLELRSPPRERRLLLGVVTVPVIDGRDVPLDVIEDLGNSESLNTAARSLPRGDAQFPQRFLL